MSAKRAKPQPEAQITPDGQPAESGPSADSTIAQKAPSVPVIERGGQTPTLATPECSHEPARPLPEQIHSSGPNEAPAGRPDFAPIDTWRLEVMDANQVVAEAARDVVDAEARVDAAKAELKAARSRHDMAVRELVDVINQRHQAKLPFKPTTEPQPEQANVTSYVEHELPGGDGLYGNAKCTFTPQAEPAHPDSEDWKDIPIGDLQSFGLDANIVVKLVENKLTTLGKLAKFSEQNVLEDLRGIGEVAVGRIDDALERFWSDRNARSES